MTVLLAVPCGPSSAAGLDSRQSVVSSAQQARRPHAVMSILGFAARPSDCRPPTSTTVVGGGDPHVYFRRLVSLHKWSTLDWRVVWIEHGMNDYCWIQNLGRGERCRRGAVVARTDDALSDIQKQRNLLVTQPMQRLQTTREQS